MSLKLIQSGLQRLPSLPIDVPVFEQLVFADSEHVVCLGHKVHAHDCIPMGKQ